METLITILAMGFVCMSCFFIGAKVGQTVSKGEDIKLPNPVEAVKTSQKRKAADKEQDRLDTIMRNIEAYDGTGGSQKDLPR